MKRFFLFALLILPVTLSAQNKNSKKPPRIKVSQDWKVLEQKGDVTFWYKNQECHDNKNDIHKENLLLKVENTSDSPVTVNWKEVLWYDGTCKNCNTQDPEDKRSLDLGPGEVKQGGCDSKSSDLVVFYQFLTSGKGYPDTKLTGLDLVDLTIE